MMTRCALLTAILTMVVSSSVHAAWVHEKTDGTLLYFSDSASKKSTRLKTGVKSLQFYSVLTDSVSGQAYALYSGFPCENCGPEQLTLFMSRVDGGGAPFSFVFPGEIKDPKKGLVYQSRGFYGNCLPKVKSGYVAHQGEHVDRKQGFQKSVLTAVPGPAKVDDQLDESRRQPSLKTTLELVKRKVCFEIAGRPRSVLKKNLGADSKLVIDTEEDDEEVDQSDDKKTETPATLESEAGDKNSPATAPGPEKKIGN